MAAEERAGTTGSPVSPPPQVTMGLLDYITAHSLDEDYAHVSERDASEGEPKPARAGLAALVILGLFGLLVVTAALQTSRNAVASEDGHNQLVTQVKARSAQVNARRNRVTELRDEVGTLRTQYLDTTAQGRQLNTRLTGLGVRTGASAVTGPGARVVVDAAPNATSSRQQVLDKDLQKLANGLWEAGAEAISINDSTVRALATSGPLLIGGCNMAVHVGRLRGERFDERWRHAEDIEFTSRVGRHAGWAVAPAARVWHESRARMGTYFGQMYRYGLWKVRYTLRTGHVRAVDYVPSAALVTCAVAALALSPLALLGFPALGAAESLFVLAYRRPPARLVLRIFAGWLVKNAGWGLGVLVALVLAASGRPGPRGPAPDTR